MIAMRCRSHLTKKRLNKTAPVNSRTAPSRVMPIPGLQPVAPVPPLRSSRRSRERRFGDLALEVPHHLGRPRIAICLLMRTRIGRAPRWECEMQVVANPEMRG